MERKKQLIRLTNYSLEVFHELITNTPVYDLEKGGHVDHWSFKDHMAHLAHWLDRFNHRLIKRDKNYKEITDFDKENARIWELNHAVEWQVIHANLEKAYMEIPSTFGSQLKRTCAQRICLYPPENRPLWNSILDATCAHTITHAGLIYNERGNFQKSVEILDKIFEDLISLDPTPPNGGAQISITWPVFIPFRGIK